MKCPMWISWVVLILGIIYLIVDLMNWGGSKSLIGWWNLNWWTAVFILAGLAGLGKKK